MNKTNPQSEWWTEPLPIIDVIRGLVWVEAVCLRTHSQIPSFFHLVLLSFLALHPFPQFPLPVSLPYYMLCGCQVLRICGMWDCSGLIKFALFPLWPEHWEGYGTLGVSPESVHCRADPVHSLNTLLSAHAHTHFEPRLISNLLFVLQHMLLTAGLWIGWGYMLQVDLTYTQIWILDLLDSRPDVMFIGQKIYFKHKLYRVKSASVLGWVHLWNY